MSDASRIKQQLENAFNGPAWHGPSLMENLKGVSAEVAAAKPVTGAHSIWEIINHLLAWQNETVAVLGGKLYVSLQGEADWPPVREPSQAAWDTTLNELTFSHTRLCDRLNALSDVQLRENVPGQDYSWGVLLRGISNHTLYHAGQIGLLKSALSKKAA
jgi:uncharacterized damage-inducible protein DinB